ncbi:acetyltransferase [Campylobacter sp. US33a]|uniref:PglD-related sugar-binding protein n=1 Tax=Campylobacter sp. US33a TaxID=2498120 RepID=UPI0010679A5C|nr:acetyltransferase [Campylobacter sp. US33a]TEY02788.1 acetyltransferase [Campylobacter sp. US33a]
MKEKIILIGAGGHANSCIDVIELENKFKIAGFVVNDATQKSFKYPILGCDDDLKNLFKHYKFAFIAIGQIKNAYKRMQIYEKLKSIGFKLPTIVSPLAYVSPYAFVDEASIIMHQALVNVNAKIGKACIINSKALIEHDSTVQDFCHISTAAVVNGECFVKKGSFLGSNTHLKHTQILEERSIFYNKLSIMGGGN